MMKFLVIFALLAVGTQAKTLQLVNGLSFNIAVNVTNVSSQVLSLAAGGVIILDLDAGFSGSISAVPENTEVPTEFRTKVDLTIGNLRDSYSVSMADGYNLGAKVIPLGSNNCPAAVCVATSILKLCPLASQLTNSNGTVVACQNSPLVMATVCPLAVVDSVTALLNVKTCSSATGYLVIFTN